MAAQYNAHYLSNRVGRLLVCPAKSANARIVASASSGIKGQNATEAGGPATWVHALFRVCAEKIA